MLQKYVSLGKKKLRCGYTTGSCAAGAAKAACEMLITQNKTDSVRLLTPKGIELDLEILEAEFAEDHASCAVKKDSGDDPDITNGILVFARCEKIPFGIRIEAGAGIGRVTKKGLDQPVGEAAINSVPRKMIEYSISEIAEKYDYTGGIRVVISIPEGEAIAKKTFNPRLGIEGGISVIGTTGIVEPMSSQALIETIRTEAKVLKAQNYKNLILTVGNYSKSFLSKEMPFVCGKNVTCSNFLGEAIDIALELDFESVLIIGHIGKLVKLGAGIMNTHSKQADGRMEVLVTCGVLAGADIETLKKIPSCVTVDSALEEFDKAGKIPEISAVLMKRTQHYLNAKVQGEIKIGALMFSDKYGIIGKTETADELIKIAAEEYNG